MAPPPVQDVDISFPSKHVLLVTLNRPKHLNAIYRDLHPQLAALWAWYDAEPSLRCAVITGKGRAFCAGADLKEWDNKNQAGKSDGNDRHYSWPDTGFGGMSNRRGKKPIIAAINGLCLGGGMEMALNTDMIIAAEDAKFGLPEVKIGVIAVAGALPRVIRTVGKQRAAEMALLGRMYGAKEMAQWGIVNKVVEGQKEAVQEALKWATELAGNSPDSVIVTMEGLLGGWDPEDPVSSTKRVENGIYQKLDGGENQKEGVKSFVEKRKPNYRDSKL